MMKRHLEWYTKPDQSLKDRSRFWTWYMRGLHGKSELNDLFIFLNLNSFMKFKFKRNPRYLGDMDTRYEGDRSCLSRASSQVPR